MVDWVVVGGFTHSKLVAALSSHEWNSIERRHNPICLEPWFAIETLLFYLGGLATHAPRI
jgi:hypothetical protein